MKTVVKTVVKSVVNTCDKEVDLANLSDFSKRDNVCYLVF